MEMKEIAAYLRQADLSSVPGWKHELPFEIFPLAQGEYNLNYRLRQGEQEVVFRVNLGTQINREDQIRYEYEALRLLAETGKTPRPYYLDDSFELMPHGILIMEYLPGEALDYWRDIENAARLFANIHTQTSTLKSHHLIVEEHPLSMTFEECAGLLEVYFNSELSDPALCIVLQEVLSWAENARHKEKYFTADPWPCIINTEVNSGNFIVNRQAGTIHLVDWEKPLWGDPSQDLSHFCVPTTTLWKTDYRMTPEARNTFLSVYRSSLDDAHLKDTVEDRVRLRDPFNCLRGISWSAMAWITYQSGEHALQNADTFHKIETYMQLDFICGLFEPYMS